MPHFCIGDLQSALRRPKCWLSAECPRSYNYGLQLQLDALHHFCPGRHLPVNLRNTKVVILEARKSDCKQSVFGGTTVERHDEYRYLGFVFCATKSVCKHHGTWQIPGCWERCSTCHATTLHLPHLLNPATICKLSEILVLLNLSYSCVSFGSQSHS